MFIRFIIFIFWILIPEGENSSDVGDFLSFLCFEGVSKTGEVPKTLGKVERVKGIEPSSQSKLEWRRVLDCANPAVSPFSQ